MGPTATLTPCAKTTLPEAAAQCPWDTHGEAKVAHTWGTCTPAKHSRSLPGGLTEAFPHLPALPGTRVRANSAISGSLNFSPVLLTSCRGISPNKSPILASAPLIAQTNIPSGTLALASLRPESAGPLIRPCRSGCKGQWPGKEEDPGSGPVLPSASVLSLATLDSVSRPCLLVERGRGTRCLLALFGMTWPVPWFLAWDPGSACSTEHTWGQGQEPL